MITVIASIVDKNGIVKRLNNDIIKFEIKGEGSIIGDANIMANPIEVEWGTAPVLVRSTTTPGEITIKASILNEGIHTPISGEITFKSVASVTPLLFSEEPYKIAELQVQNQSINDLGNNSEQTLKRKILELEKELNEIKLKEVEKQQQEFEGKKKRN